jgi:periplasmic divalent cation tolerance protein
MTSPNREYRLILNTCPDQAQAERIATALVEGKLAACVNILPGVQSVYRWHGKVERDAEVLLLIKTELACVAAVEQCIRTLHSYEVPEIIALPISHGHLPYLNWITESIQT